MFDVTGVGLLSGGSELHGQGYARQPFAERVRFGPATGGPWGRVDGVFMIIDGDLQATAPIEPLDVRMGNTVDVKLTIELVT